MREHLTKQVPGVFAPVWVVYLFASALLFQSFHTLEHLIQLYQHAVLGIDIIHAHGLLFFFDTEWIHFLFNTSYLTCLFIIFFGIGLHKKKVRTILPTMYAAGFIFLIGFEIWHVMEHVTRLYQHLDSGCQPCRGIFGQLVDVLYLHTFYNSTVSILSLITFFNFGFAKRFWQLL